MGFMTQPVRQLLMALAMFCAVTTSMQVLAKAAIPSISTKMASANVAAGEQAFQLCAGCHASQSGKGSKVGPNLWNVVGRRIASTSGFSYSDNFKTREGSWDNDTLNQFLHNPGGFVVGTRMAIPGIADEQQRINIIAYLNTLNDKPVVVETSVANIAPAKDPFGDNWPQGDGRELTGYTCSICHSLAIVKQQGLSRGNWDELIEWMVDEQGMDELADEKLQSVLDYLSNHFNEDRQLK